MKTCKRCGVEKPLTGFYRQKGMADGYLNFCKECTKARVTKHRKRNLDRIREYDRMRGNRQDPEYFRELRERKPNQYSAQNAVNNALRDGKLLKEDYCSCGSTATVAHHLDYLKPLEVIWLCQACHVQWHTLNGKALNPF